MKYIFLLVTGTLLSLRGCSKPHPKPPMERAELTARFFQSMEKKQPDLAIRQGKMLHALNGSTELLQLIAIQESNAAVANAQKELQDGHIDLAIRIIDKAKRDYPQNHSLTSIYPSLFQLRNASKLLTAMKRARTASGMSGALIAARSGLSFNMTPEMERFLADYEKRTEEVAAAEAAATLAREKAMAEAAKKAHTEDTRIKTEDQHFQTVTTEKNAANAEAIKKAGPLPERPAKGE